MKKVMMICITTAVMAAPLAAYARPGRLFVAPALGGEWYSPYWEPYPYGYYDYAPTNGAVKFDTRVQDAEVYIDGAYAGPIGKLKTIQLRPGSYDIGVHAPGRTQFDKKAYIAAGKTLHLNPDLRVQVRPQAQP
jgi:hypothetical protein